MIRSYVDAIRYQREAGFLRKARIAVQIARARLLYGIGPRYFCVFRLADKPASKWSDYVIEFSAFKRRLAALTPREVHVIADDKVRFHAFCRDHGLATIPIEFLVLHPTAARYAGIQTVTTVGEWQSAMERAEGPLFLKPVDGVWGQGAFRVERVSGGCEFDGHHGSLEEAFRFVTSRLEGTGGYVVQRRVINDPAICALTSGTGLSTVRMVTCRRAGSVRLLYGLMKLTVGQNVTDNFHHGTTGNLIARIDLASGQLGTAVGTLRTDWPVMADFMRHPDSDEMIEGFRIPHWSAAVRLVTNAHQALPELRVTGWDVSIAPNGPLIVETNPRFAFDILQIAHGRGIKREVMEAVGMI